MVVSLEGYPQSSAGALSEYQLSGFSCHGLCAAGRNGGPKCRLQHVNINSKTFALFLAGVNTENKLGNARN